MRGRRGMWIGQNMENRLLASDHYHCFGFHIRVVESTNPYPKDRFSDFKTPSKPGYSNPPFLAVLANSRCFVQVNRCVFPLPIDIFQTELTGQMVPPLYPGTLILDPKQRILSPFCKWNESQSGWNCGCPLRCSLTM